MQPTTKQFLIDLFDVRELCIQDIQPHLMQNASTVLNMQSLFSDPLIRASLVFRRFWNATLKTQPSFETASKFMETLPKQSASNADELCNHIVKYVQTNAPIFDIIASRMFPEGFGTQTLKDAISYFSDRIHVKRALVDKFMHRFGRVLPVTEAEYAQNLLVTYETFWKESLKTIADIIGPAGPENRIDDIIDYYEYTDAVIDLLNINHRLGVDTFSGYQSDAFIVRRQGNTMMTVFEAASHAAALNGSMMLNLIGSHCVYVHSADVDEEHVHLALKAVHDREDPSQKIVLMASQNVIDRIRQRDVGFGIHTLHLLHPCMAIYLPRVAASFVAILDRPETPFVTLAQSGKTVIYCTKVSEQQQVPISRQLVCALDSSAFGRDLSHFCLRRKLDEAPHEVLYHDFVAKYCAYHMKKMVASEATPNATNAIVIVDNRPNFLNIVAVKSCLMNLKSGQWDVVVFCLAEDVAFYKARLGHEATYITDAKLPSPKRFSMVFYNELLKSPSFWARLTKYKRVLMAQDDGFLIKPGMEDEFIDFDYVGAPWNKSMQYNKYMETWGLAPNYVGNGGLSLRNPMAMLDICSKHTVARKGIHFDCLQVEPEDVFFAKMCLKKGFKVPSYEHAQRFSSEETMSDSYGFHKVFGYFPPHLVQAFFDKCFS